MLVVLLYISTETSLTCTFVATRVSESRRCRGFRLPEGADGVTMAWVTKEEGVTTVEPGLGTTIRFHHNKGGTTVVAEGLNTIIHNSLNPTTNSTTFSSKLTQGNT